MSSQRLRTPPPLCCVYTRSMAPSSLLLLLLLLLFSPLLLLPVLSQEWPSDCGTCPSGYCINIESRVVSKKKATKGHLPWQASKIPQ